MGGSSLVDFSELNHHGLILLRYYPLFLAVLHRSNKEIFQYNNRSLLFSWIRRDCTTCCNDQLGDEMALRHSMLMRLISGPFAKDHMIPSAKIIYELQHDSFLTCNALLISEIVRVGNLVICTKT